MTWEEIAAQLGYRGPGGPRMAVERLLSRVEHEGAAELRQIESRRLDELLSGVWPKATGGDCDAIRTVLRISERRSKLLGLDAPVGVAVQGISEREFAEAARELLEVTGIRPLVEAALPALEPAERAAWFSAADGTADDADDDGDSEPWSNIGPQHQLLYATQQSAPDTAPAEDRPAGEPVAADDNQGDEAGEIEIEAEVVEPEDDEPEVIVPSARRVPAAAVWGRSVNPYAPLASWRPGQTRHRR